MTLMRLGCGNMLRCSRPCAGLVFMALLASASGCDRAWEAYQEIELGRPLAAGSLLAEEGGVKDSVRAWDDYAIVHLPALVKTQALRVVLDDAGNVACKYYLANDFAHWVVFRTAKYRWVMEVQLPKAADGRPAQLTVIRSHLLDVTKRIDEVWAQPRGNVCFLDKLTAGLFFWWGFIQWGHGGEPEMQEIADVPELLRGVTDADYDRTWKNPDGGTCRIRNLGDGRIRIESSYFGVFDTIRVVHWKKRNDTD